MKATRDAYGETLVELGRANPNVVVLDADLSGSTKTRNFAKVFPERFFNAGIAEANMIGMAAGLASSGKIPFASTFAVFATGRAYDQIRQSVAYPRLPVKIVASHGGLTVGPDGASHQSLEDIALMRVMPNMAVIVPADARETAQAVRAAIDYEGPVYIRLGREPVPYVVPEDSSFELGKGTVIYPGGGKQVVADVERTFDVSFIACGVTVASCLDAAKILEGQGFFCSVSDFASIKPLDKALLLDLSTRSRLIVTAEEHSVIGGLGGAVCEYLSEVNPVRVLKVGVQDVFGQSGLAGELLEYYGLTGLRIAERVKEALRSST